MGKPKRIIDYDEMLAVALPKGFGRTVAELHVDERAALEAVIERHAAGAYAIKSESDNSDGPTKKRIERALNNVSVGDDKVGGKVYTFLDSPLDQLYGVLVRAATTENQVDRLRHEYAALTKYYRLFVESGMVGSIGSVDPNRTYSPSPSGRTFLAGSERQQNCRDEYREAVIHLNNSEEWGHKQTIVVDNVCCHENSLLIAAYSIGEDSVDTAKSILRDAGYRLARMWGMVR